MKIHQGAITHEMCCLAPQFWNESSLIATKHWIQNHEIVVKELSGSHQTFIRQLSGSHQANMKLSTIFIQIFRSLCGLKDFSILLLFEKCVGVWGCKCPVDLELGSNKALNSKWAVASIYTSTVNSKNRLDFAFERAHKRVRSLLIFQNRLLTMYFETTCEPCELRGLGGFFDTIFRMNFQTFDQIVLGYFEPGRGVSEKVSAVGFCLGSGLFGSCNSD